MNYQLLGKLPESTIEFFLEEILKRKVSDKPYQWIHFDNYLNSKFLEIFKNTELSVQWAQSGQRPIQKALYSDPSHGFRIHKDGTQCKSAMNIALSCNPGDWVRWYDEDYINKIGSVEILDDPRGSSRDVDIYEYEDIPYVQQENPQCGEVYLVNTDVYHSFKCNGNSPRIIIQTKFAGYPDFNTIRSSLMSTSFDNLIKNNE